MTKNDIIEYVYKSENVNRFCNSLYPADFNELKSNVIMVMYKMKYSDLLNAYENKYIEYTAMSIASRIKNGNVKGDVFYKFKKIKTEQLDYNLETEYESIDEIVEKLEEDEVKYNKIQDILRTIHPCDKLLFNFYYKDGLNLREISELTGVNISSIAYYIKKTKKKIKDNI